MDAVDILIVGGGVAGLATAFHLARAGAGSLALLDRELHPGFYASGHNAAIARTLTGHRHTSTLALEGRSRLEELGLLRRCGGLLLGAEAGSLDALEAEARELGVEAALGAGPGLEGLRAAEHLAIPGDGVIDIHGLLGRCAEGARQAGAKLCYGRGVAGIQVLEDGFLVETSEGPLKAARLVNAAGAWAAELGRMAGGLDVALRPLRRHLAWTEHAWPEAAPWAWWVDRPFYLRPESGGALLCPCDEAEVPLPGPGRQPDTDPAALERLAGLTEALAPELEEAAVTRAWSGLRTFSPDGDFIIGADPKNPRLFWVAGLAGHGMTTGLAVGRLAAELLLSGQEHPLSPKRFV